MEDALPKMWLGRAVDTADTDRFATKTIYELQKGYSTTVKLQSL